MALDADDFQGPIEAVIPTYGKFARDIRWGGATLLALGCGVAAFFPSISIEALLVASALAIVHALAGIVVILGSRLNVIADAVVMTHNEAEGWKDEILGKLP